MLHKDLQLPCQKSNEMMAHSLTANTGSGKSTQTPQYILDEYIQAGKGADCRILVTQPRRVSAFLPNATGSDADIGSRPACRIGFGRSGL